MKFIALTLLSVVGLIKADQQYTVGINVHIDGVTGGADPKCTAAVEAALVEAYAEAFPDSDNHLESVHIDHVEPEYLSTELGTSGSYTYNGSGNNRCTRCRPLLSAAFAGKEALLEAVGTTDDMEAKTLSILQASDSHCFNKITDLSIEWLRSGLETPVTPAVKLGEQHFSVGINVHIDGAHGGADPKCTAAVEAALVEAYSEAYPDSDVHLESVHFDSVAPDAAVNLGTSGSYTYNGSGNNRCTRCRPMSLSYSSKHELLTAVGTTDEMEAKTLSILKASDCHCFNKISDLSIEWVRSGLELDVADGLKEQHFSVGIDVTVDGASGNPSSPKCIAAAEKVVVSAYAAAYPDSDTQLVSVHFDNVTPDFTARIKNLRVSTMGSYTYNGSGNNRCTRCRPLLSASYLSKETLLEAIGTTDAFEADILSMLKALDSSECNSFKKITDVTVEWIRDGEALDIANA